MKLRQTILLQFVTVVCLALSLSAQKARDFKLEPLSPKFLELIGDDAKLETVADRLWLHRGADVGSGGVSLRQRRDDQQDLSRVSERQEGRSHRVGRPGRKYLRSPASVDRLCERSSEPSSR